MTALWPTECNISDAEDVWSTEKIPIAIDLKTGEMKESEMPPNETMAIFFEARANEIEPDTIESGVHLETDDTKDTEVLSSTDTNNQELINGNVSELFESKTYELEKAIKSETVLELDENVSKFSCFGRSLGQYADVSKECRVFHLCYPFLNESSGQLLYQRLTFLCDEESVFDQERLICTENATMEHSCQDSEALYKTSNQKYLIRILSQTIPANSEIKRSDIPSNRRGWFNWLSTN